MGKIKLDGYKVPIAVGSDENKIIMVFPSDPATRLHLKVAGMQSRYRLPDGIINEDALVAQVERGGGKALKEFCTDVEDCVLDIGDEEIQLTAEIDIEELKAGHPGLTAETWKDLIPDDIWSMAALEIIGQSEQAEDALKKK